MGRLEHIEGILAFDIVAGDAHDRDVAPHGSSEGSNRA
jgi:hypothetical protein